MCVCASDSFKLVSWLFGTRRRRRRRRVSLCAPLQRRRWRRFISHMDPSYSTVCALAIIDRELITGHFEPGDREYRARLDAHAREHTHTHTMYTQHRARFGGDPLIDIMRRLRSSYSIVLYV